VIDRDCYGITVSANVIAHDSGGGVDLRDAWGCAVSANTFTICAGDAVAVRPDSGRITISGNNFSNAHIGDKRRRDDAAMGVLLQSTSDVAISGNVFTGMAREAVKIEGECDRIVLDGNVIHDISRAEPGKFRALDLDGTDVLKGENVISEETSP
jgi:hypothetical protein